MNQKYIKTAMSIAFIILLVGCQQDAILTDAKSKKTSLTEDFPSMESTIIPSISSVKIKTEDVSMTAPMETTTPTIRTSIATEAATTVFLIR